MANRHPKWSLPVGRRLDLYLSQNFKTTLKGFKPGLASIRRELLKKHATSAAQREIRRRCAEMYCGQCLERAAPWPIVRSSIVALDAVGYTNVERRAHFAILLGRYAVSEPRARASAKVRVADALRRVRAAKRGPWRKQFETWLQDVK